MSISGIGGSGYTPLPVFQDMAVVLAARTSVTDLAAKVAVQVSGQADGSAAATSSAASTSGSSVDLYL